MIFLQILLDITQGTEVASAVMGSNTAIGLGIGGTGGAAGGIAYVKWQLNQQAERIAKTENDIADHVKNHASNREMYEVKKEFNEHIKKHGKDDREIFNFISTFGAKMDNIETFMARIGKKLP